MQEFKIKDFYRRPKKMQQLLDRYDNLIQTGDMDGAEEVFYKIAELVGVIFTTTSKKIGKNFVDIPVMEFDEISFSAYLHKSFTVIAVGDSVAFYNYNMHRYEFLKESVFLAFFKEILDEIDEGVWKVKLEKDVAIRFQRDIKTRLSGWEIPEGKVVFTNGVLDVRDMSFDKGDHPEIFTFHCTGYDYAIQDAPYHCPNFLKFIWSVFEDDKLIKNIQEQYGYTLAYGINKAEHLFIWDGGGRNGKSINQRVVELINGVENCGSATLTQICSRFGPAMIYNKVVNFCAENDNVVYESGFIKTVTGQDRVFLDRKYESGLEAKIVAKMFIVTNAIYFNDRSRGLAERIIALPFDFTFVDSPKSNSKERKKDVDILAKIEPEIPQITLWALEGLQRLMKNNWQFTRSPKAEALKRKILQDSNPVLLFYDHCCKHAPGQVTKMSDAYALFREYADQNDVNVGAVVSANRFRESFGAILEEHGLSKSPKRVNGNDVYSNITISI